MKEFLEELKWACTKSSLKGFYTMVTILWVALMLGCVASFVMLVANLIMFHVIKALWVVLFIVTLAVSIGIFIFLKKS